MPQNVGFYPKNTMFPKNTRFVFHWPASTAAPVSSGLASTRKACGSAVSSCSGRVMRYTVERDAVAGGAECPHDDGYSEKHPC